MANPGYSRRPDRTSPALKNSGRAANAEPTSPSDQTPAEIFGAPTALSSTGLNGSAGAGTPGDVTQVSDQSHDRISGQGSDHSQTTLDGSTGASVPTGGPAVTYTDIFANMGSRSLDGARVQAQGQIDGSNDWTQGSAKYDHGPTLPGLEGHRPTSTGVGEGSIRGAGKGL